MSPIRAEMRGRYPLDWKTISFRIRFDRAEGRCECPGGAEGCGLHRGHRCEERHGEPAKWARGKVILTVMHLDHDPGNVEESNLRAACQRCHNRYDASHRRQGQAERCDVRNGQMRFNLDVTPAERLGFSDGGPNVRTR